MPEDNLIPPLTLHELAVAHQAIRLVRGEPSQVLVAEGRDDPHLLFVLSGEVDGMSGERRLHTFERGALLGAHRVFTDRSAARMTLRCASRTLLMEVSADAFRGLVDQHNPVAWALERAALTTQSRLLRELDRKIGATVTGSRTHLPTPNAGLFARFAARHLARSSDESVALMLRDSPMFLGAKFAHLEKLAEHLDLRTLASGDRLVTQGEAPESAFVIVEGRATALIEGTSGRYGTLGTLTAPSFVGVASMVDGSPHSATVVAEGAVTALAIDHTACHALVHDGPAYASALRQAMIRALVDLTAHARAGLAEAEESLRRAVRADLGQPDRE